jgi:DNA-binding transcriptional ArsR family regulator
MSFFIVYICLIDYSVIMKTEAQFLKSLGDETSLKILWLLAQRQELCV